MMTKHLVLEKVHHFSGFLSFFGPAVRLAALKGLRRSPRIKRCWEGKLLACCYDLTTNVGGGAIDFDPATEESGIVGSGASFDIDSNRKAAGIRKS